MPISCIYGLPGRNKTHFTCYYALNIANKFKKCIVANFLFHPDNLLTYCAYMQYDWLISRLKSDEPLVYYCPMESKDGLTNLLSISNSVIICDEAGGYFPARGSTHSTPQQFLKDITQVRHRKQYALFITQSENLLDSAIRVLADEIIFCNGITVYDTVLDAPKLIYKTVRRFTPEKFASWNSNPRLKGNPIKSMMMANKSWTGQLSWSDYFLFSVYPSFYLVHAQETMLQENNYFPDSKTRYSQQNKFAGASAPAPRPGIVIDADSLKSLLSTKQQTQNEKFSTLPHILPSTISFPNRSSFECWLFKNLPAEFLPLIQKLNATSLFKFDFKGNKLARNTFICLFSLTIFLTTSTFFALISRLSRMVLSHS